MNTASPLPSLLSALSLLLLAASCSDSARRRVAESARRAGLSPVFIDFEALVRAGKPFPWQKGVQAYYAFVPSDTGLADLAVDGAGNLYVAALGNVWRVGKSGKIDPLLQSAWLHTGGEPFPRDRAAGVSCIAVSQDGSLLWIVSHDHALYLWRDTRLRFVAGDLYDGDRVRSGCGEAARMTHVYNVASFGEKVVVACAHAICECDTNGHFAVMAGSEDDGCRNGPAKEALFSGPRVAPHHRSGLWIVDWSGIRLLRDGAVSTLSREVIGAWDVVLGSDNRLYAARERLLVAVDDGGNVTAILGSREPTREFGWAIGSFAIDAEGNIFVAYSVAFD